MRPERANEAPHKRHLLLMYFPPRCRTSICGNLYCSHSPMKLGRAPQVMHRLPLDGSPNYFAALAWRAGASFAGVARDLGGCERIHLTKRALPATAALNTDHPVLYRPNSSLSRPFMTLRVGVTGICSMNSSLSGSLTLEMPRSVRYAHSSGNVGSIRPFGTTKQHAR